MGQQWVNGWPTLGRELGHSWSTVAKQCAHLGSPVCQCWPLVANGPSTSCKSYCCNMDGKPRRRSFAFVKLGLWIDQCAHMQYVEQHRLPQVSGFTRVRQCCINRGPIVGQGWARMREGPFGSIVGQALVNCGPVVGQSWANSGSTTGQSWATSSPIVCQSAGGVLGWVNSG